ncbi:MAG: hypothetical protein DRR42_20010, partial [Gammaproteobacteria bacterium]
KIAPSPFHKGEQELQALYDVRERIEDMGQRVIRDYMPLEHREFYEQLPYVFAGSIDDSGRPWASLLFGQPGFIQSADKYSLNINFSRINGDPLNSNISKGSAIGILGLQFEARRRNRLSASVESSGNEVLNLDVVQSFGNCPQYIQARQIEARQIEPDDKEVPEESHRKSSFKKLSTRAKQIIGKADSFYIATYHAGEKDTPSNGADVSHRGGKPGFVRVDNDSSITFPDFTGNFHFNTLGNILLNPLAGLLFIDFDTGDLLYLTCHAEIIHESEEKRAFESAERLVHFELDEGILIERALPFKWGSVKYSPSLDGTGSWDEVAETLAVRRSTNIYRNYKVVRIDQESDEIRSFYLQPDKLENGNAGEMQAESIQCHRAGQFLPIEIKLPGHDASIKRTYTISNAPNGEFFRLSIKREPATSAEHPPGLSSNYFHDHVKEGSKICALSPRGQFVLEQNSTRPVVLLSAGVGITPMVSMLEALAQQNMTCGGERRVWFIHGARNSQSHAFNEHIKTLIGAWPEATEHNAYSAPLKTDRLGSDYHSHGRVNADLLKLLLPADDQDGSCGFDSDYDFYFCGPPAFMTSIYDGLKQQNVADNRIHYEFFGPGASLLKSPSGERKRSAVGLDVQNPLSVHFAKSDIQVVWELSSGTLLDLAEQQGLTPPYSCRSGVCGTCATKLIEGDVSYADPPLAEIQDGYALICCAYPGKLSKKNSKLKIEL